MAVFDTDNANFWKEKNDKKETALLRRLLVNGFKN
jgi:hypothetical protein